MSLMSQMDDLHLQVLQFGKDVKTMRANYEARITELEAQLEAAKQVANDCRIVADNAIAEALAAKKDAERYIKHCRNPQVAAWCGLDPNAADVLVQLDEFIDAAIAEGKA